MRVSRIARQAGATAVAALVSCGAAHAQLPVITSDVPAFDAATQMLTLPMLRIGDSHYTNLSVLITGAEVKAIGPVRPVGAWLQGTWEGGGYQLGGLTWSMVFTADANTYTIRYPSISCAGTWVLRKLDGVKAEFDEVISQGSTNCPNGRVVVTRVDDRYVTYSWWHTDGRLGAFSTLTKR